MPTTFIPNILNLLIILFKTLPEYTTSSTSIISLLLMFWAILAIWFSNVSFSLKVILLVLSILVQSKKYILSSHSLINILSKVTMGIVSFN